MKHTTFVLATLGKIKHSYKLKFLPKGWKEWSKLAPPIRAQFKKKLAERLVNPRVPGDKLSGYNSVYKIKLRTAGYRLAYEVFDSEVSLAHSRSSQ